MSSTLIMYKTALKETILNFTDMSKFLEEKQLTGLAYEFLPLLVDPIAESAVENEQCQSPLFEIEAVPIDTGFKASIKNLEKVVNKSNVRQLIVLQLVAPRRYNHELLFLTKEGYIFFSAIINCLEDTKKAARKKVATDFCKNFPIRMVGEKWSIEFRPTAFGAAGDIIAVAKIYDKEDSTVIRQSFASNPFSVKDSTYAFQEAIEFLLMNASVAAED